MKKFLLLVSTALLLNGCVIRVEVIEPQPQYRRIYQLPICTHSRMNIDGICPYSCRGY